MKYPQLLRAIEVVHQLRHPTKGCPWDLEQTHQSLLKYLFEESYEFAYSVEFEPSKMEEELGDLLLQVLLHSKIGEEEKTLSLEGAAQKLADKLIRRHPHVFDSQFIEKHQTRSKEQIIEDWAKIKSDEQKSELNHTNDKMASYRLKEEDLFMNSLSSAQKIGVKTKRIGFDWSSPSQVIYKVEEEWQELKEELASLNSAKDLKHLSIDHKNRIEEELGDLLFSVAQLARHLELDSEQTLKKGNRKFKNRYHLMLDLMAKENLDPKSMEEDELEDFWKKAKTTLKAADTQNKGQHK